MNTSKRAALGCATSIALAAVAASAHADGRPSMQSVCRNFPCVYDQNGLGVIVGIPADGYHLDRQIGSTWYMLAVSQNGLLDNLLLYYTSSDCTGQPYFENIQMPLFAWYDGQSIWAPTGSAISAVYHSYAYGNPWYCTPIASYGQVLLQPAVKVERARSIRRSKCNDALIDPQMPCDLHRHVLSSLGEEVPQPLPQAQLGGLHLRDVAAAAAGANEPCLPVKHGRLGTISGGLLDGIGLDLAAAIPAPYDEPHAGRSRVAERHRRARLGFQPKFGSWVLRDSAESVETTAMGTETTSLMVHPQGEQPEIEARSAIADTYAGRVHVGWDATAPVTPFGQLPFFIEYLKQGGLLPDRQPNTGIGDARRHYRR